ncbi:MAG: polysaccharide deacetylase family protein [Acidobacteriia bacterium]|nr:polysaccharide deacetylase family protein [Terriglobia bacterium]
MENANSAILTYHSIDESNSAISTSAHDFERQMDALAGSSAAVVPLGEVRDRPGSIALTFDDGFRNFRTAAAPVLERHKFSATVFIVSGFCGNNNRWPGQCRDVPELPLMDWDEVREISSRGFSVGAHTVHHPDLRALPESEALREMADCKAEIEQQLGGTVTQFAYPYGSVPAHVRPPFELACGTRLSYLRPGADAIDLPRIDAFYLRAGPSAGSLFSARAAAYFGGRAILRNLRQWLSQ